MKKYLLVFTGLFLGLIFNTAFSQDKLDKETKRKIIRKIDRVLKKSLKNMEKEIKEMLKEEIAKFKEEKTREEKGVTLGIEEVELSDRERELLELEKGVGIKIGKVEKGSPAEKAGLQKGDIIIKIGDQNATPDLLLKTLKELRPPQKLKIKVIRRIEKEIEVEFEK
jgi:C-terminal processing protease CtpA/Prc